MTTTTSFRAPGLKYSIINDTLYEAKQNRMWESVDVVFNVS